MYSITQITSQANSFFGNCIGFDPGSRLMEWTSAGYIFNTVHKIKLDTQDFTFP